MQAGLRSKEDRDRIFYLGVGCDHCNYTGYRGRTAIHELLGVTDSIRNLIIDRRPASEIRQVAHAEGLKSLRASALRKLFSGHTTLHEIKRVTFAEETK